MNGNSPSRGPIRIKLETTSKGVSFSTDKGRKGFLQIPGDMGQKIEAAQRDLTTWFGFGEGYSPLRFVFSSSLRERLNAMHNQLARETNAVYEIINTEYRQ